jgi:hypothetical protein
MTDKHAPKTTDPMRVRMLRWMLMDALRHASGVAARCQEATEGNGETLLFEDARRAIVQFADSHPAMRALSEASVRDMT